jgi:L-alanine-DL-glutamate epimerase-like enolase superfamily enzyme
MDWYSRYVLSWELSITLEMAFFFRRWKPGFSWPFRRSSRQIRPAVFADESVVTLADPKDIVDTQAAHGINLKLQKAGGIQAGTRMLQYAERANPRVMVGSMFEGPISIACGVHFSASSANIILTDLDMDLDLPLHHTGQAGFCDGRRIPSTNPGHGVVLDRGRIDELVARGELLFERVV